jgi:hypothetical protein
LAKSAERKPRRLKVYQAAFGFHESVVAAPNQAAALRAWGVRQNLFAEGQAKVATDENGITAAQAHPEVPLRRAVGSDDPFVLQPPTPAKPLIEAEPRSRREKPASRPPAAPEAPKPPADRSSLDAAEKALAALGEARKRAEEAFRGRQETLDAEREAAKRRWKEQRKAAERMIERERRAYRDAGGKL